MNILNFGCNVFRLPGFINIDIDPENKPDLLLDIMDIDKRFPENSVDFIYAGHFFEHLSAQNGAILMGKVRKILKPFASIVITVPDYVKTTELMGIEDAERIILNHGNHVSLYDLDRLESNAKNAGFQLFTELELDRVPWMILPAVPEGLIPVPEEWQTSFIAVKT